MTLQLRMSWQNCLIGLEISHEPIGSLIKHIRFVFIFEIILLVTTNSFMLKTQSQRLNASSSLLECLSFPRINDDPYD